MEKFLNNQSVIRSAIEILPMDLTLVLSDFLKARQGQVSMLTEARKRAVLENLDILSDVISEMKKTLGEL